uniref:Secreted protein n=1 Tax=Panagrellus redivivus TaxID=6233 RepID=A0A7E4W626_PANRE
MRGPLLNVVFLIAAISCTATTFWDDLNFEPSLLPWHVGSSKELRESCINDQGRCPVSTAELEVKRCFGFEPNCAFRPDIFSFNHSKCHTKVQWPGVQNMAQQKEMFWMQADFGSLSPRLNSMRVICSSDDEKGGSYLECSDHLRICKAQNIYFDFKSFDKKRSQRYRNDIIHEGEVGGKCKHLDKELLLARTDEKSYLQSWGYELEHFASYEDFEVNSKHCDVIFDRPTIVMKLDASVNMYHHFCDFVNLYASQFINGSFSQDVDIFWWDTHHSGFGDAYFGNAWKAFTNRIPVELVDYAERFDSEEN